jgi:Ni,Fe-hydrogenase III large subunit
MKRTMIPIGPYHPLQEEAEFFQLHVEGEVVVDIDVRISYNHRGIEELASRKTFDQIPYLVERVCGICSASHPMAYVQAVEDIAQVEVPDRALYLRTIVLELERLHSHMLWIGLGGHFIGYNTVWMWMWKYREAIMDILEIVTGSRINYANAKVGGVRRDVSSELYPKLREAVESTVKPVELVLKAVIDDPVLNARLKGVGVLTEHDARAWCVTGPTARGSGVAIDVRCDDPYAAYDRLDFKKIVYTDGDVHAKMLVRCEECLESVKIVKACLTQIEPGPIDAEVREIPPGDGVGHVEAPRGETFHFVRADGSAGPVRHKVRAPSYVNIPSFRASCIGQHIADVALILASVDPCYSCTERVAIASDVKTGNMLYTFNDLARLSREKTTLLAKAGS